MVRARRYSEGNDITFGEFLFECVTLFAQKVSCIS